MSSFLGYDGFIWFIGKVEDVDDPLKFFQKKNYCGQHLFKESTAQLYR